MAREPANPSNPQSGGEEVVLTPGGWRPKSKVHFVAPDHHVSGEGGKLCIVHTATGRTVKDLGSLPKVPKEKPKRAGRPMKMAERRKGGAR